MTSPLDVSSGGELAPVSVSVYKFKYKEAGNAPDLPGPPSLLPGETLKDWDKTYTAADSRRYNTHGKSSAKSAADRKSGETRKLALRMWEEKRQSARNITTTSPGATAVHYAAQQLRSDTAIPSDQTTVPGPKTSASSPTSPEQKLSAVPTIIQSKESQAGYESPRSSVSHLDETETVDLNPVQGAQTFAQMLIAADVKKSRTASPKVESRRSSSVFDRLGTIDINAPSEKSQGSAKPRSGSVAASGDKKRQKQTNKPHQPKKPKKYKTGPGDGGRAVLGAGIGDGASESEASNDGEVYCICRGPDDHRWMIACDGCDQWFHGECINLKEEHQKLVTKFFCPYCHDKNDDLKRTEYRNICRRPECSNPIRDPKSLYCSEECGTIFWKDVLATRIRQGDEPSLGGVINKRELYSLVSQVNSIDQYKQLGTRPTINPDANFDWNTIFTDEEREIVEKGQAKIAEYRKAIEDFRDYDKVITWAGERAERANEDRSKDSRICGYDRRLAVSPVEFQAWKASGDGQRAFAEQEMPAPEREARDMSQWEITSWCASDHEEARLRGLCVRAEKKCGKHREWLAINHEDPLTEIKELNRKAREIARLERSIKLAADTREAKSRDEDYAPEGWCEDIADPSDPAFDWRDFCKRGDERRKGLKSWRYGIPSDRKYEYMEDRFLYPHERRLD